MKIIVKVKASAKENKVIPPLLKLLKIEEGTPDYYIVSVKEPPVEGKANDAVIKLLAMYFDVSRSEIRLIRGSTSKMKIFDIPL